MTSGSCFSETRKGFNGIWNVRETEQGWLISREIDRSKPDLQPGYLSYVQKATEKQGKDETPLDMVFL